jgi:hypothetical protein
MVDLWETKIVESGAVAPVESAVRPSRCVDGVQDSIWEIQAAN